MSAWISVVTVSLIRKINQKYTHNLDIIKYKEMIVKMSLVNFENHGMN